MNLDWYDYGARFYDPALGRWHVQDILAEYHFNVTPYHYVFNNPMLFIDPFGLDTAGVEPNVIPEVTIVGEKPASTKRSPSGISQLLWDIDQFLYGNHNPSKNRDANWFEEWCIRHFDMSEVQNIGEAVGDGPTSGENGNTVNTDASYEGRYPQNDEDIIEKSGGNNKDLIERNKIRSLPEPTQEFEVFHRNKKTKTDSLNWIVNQDTFKVARTVKGGVIRYDFGYQK